MKVTGLDEALERINTEIAQIENLAAAGLWEAGLKIQRASMKRTPVDTGNLRASAYTRNASKTRFMQPGADVPEAPSDTLGSVEVEVGYTAEYALSVHENLEQKLKGEPRAHFGKTAAGEEFGGGTGKGSYWDSGEPKFLEKTIIENERAIIEIVRKRSGGE